ncbi:MurT ligase domain-containing protein [Bacillus cereus]|uniref:MurT ligase domain-containing protein n=1 Tax=Bacillus cereus TaxID=1396 RepID=UPI000C2885DA|nr:MurT ligase domain-containing protein [Bacillus cereus]
MKYLAIIFGKLVAILSRIYGGKGTSITGVVALKFKKDIVKHLSASIPVKIIITGTNGKTTTSHLLAHILRDTGKKVLHNYEGANMITGIASLLVNKSDLKGTIDADIGVFEVDEGSLPKVIEQMQPHYTICTNFFRDQLDRYGDIDTLIDTVKKALDENSTKLVLNTDDPFTMRLAKGSHSKVFFGIQKGAYQFPQVQMSESKYCFYCGKNLYYETIHFGQLGIYKCSCGFKRETPNYSNAKLHTSLKGLKCVINENLYKLNLEGAYNVYNVLAAISTATELGVKSASIQKSCQSFDMQNGRMDFYEYQGKERVLNLVKNPVGTSISIAEFRKYPQSKQLVFFLSDLPADGEDISWIWDVDFEQLCHQNILFICSGKRAKDLAIRLIYAGVDEENIEILKDRKAAINYALSRSLFTYFLATYTNLQLVKSELDSTLKLSHQLERLKSSQSYKSH